MVAGEVQRFRDVLGRAAFLFYELVDPNVVDNLSEEPGCGFHLDVTVRSEDIEEKWSDAVQALAAAVSEKGARRTFRALNCPPAALVDYAESHGALRLMVHYVPPTVSDTGALVPGMHVAQFDVAGVWYPATA